MVMSPLRPALALLVVVALLARPASAALGDGLTPETAALSCNHILVLHPSTSGASSGARWVDADGPDASVASPELVYCDQDTDEGGWQLVFKTDRSADAGDDVNSDLGYNNTVEGLASAALDGFAVADRLTMRLLARAGRSEFRATVYGTDGTAAADSMYWKGATTLHFSVLSAESTYDQEELAVKLAYGDAWQAGQLVTFQTGAHGQCFYSSLTTTIAQHICTRCTGGDCGGPSEVGVTNGLWANRGAWSSAPYYGQSHGKIYVRVPVPEQDAAGDGSSASSPGRSCTHIQVNHGVTESGPRYIRPGARPDSDVYLVHCDMEPGAGGEPGGWTLVHKSDRSEDGDYTSLGFNAATGLANDSLSSGVAILPTHEIKELLEGGASEVRLEFAGGSGALTLRSAWTRGMNQYLVTRPYAPGNVRFRGTADSRLDSYDAASVPGTLQSYADLDVGVCVSLEQGFASNGVAHWCPGNRASSATSGLTAGVWLNGGEFLSPEIYHGYSVARVSVRMAIQPATGDGLSASSPARSCAHLAAAGDTDPGVRWLDPDNDGVYGNAVEVYCDGAGGTLVHKTNRANGDDQTATGTGDITSPAVDSVAVLPREPLAAMTRQGDGLTVFTLYGEDGGSEPTIQFSVVGHRHYQTEGTIDSSVSQYHSHGIRVSEDGGQTWSAGEMVDFTTQDHGMCSFYGAPRDGTLTHVCAICIDCDGDPSSYGLWLNSAAITGHKEHGVATITQSLFDPNAPSPVTECTAAPVLRQSGISGDNLVLSLDASASQYLSVEWAFAGATDAACDSGGGSWTDAAFGSSGVCEKRHELQLPLTQALAGCGFSAEPVDGGDAWFYETVLEATTVEEAAEVFGDDQNRTTVTSFRLRVEFPKNSSVTGSAGVFGAVIDQAALTEQTFDSLTQEFGWSLATSVQYPYYLEPVSAAVSGGHEFDTLPVVASGGDCSGEGTDAAPAACTQDFALSANETDDCFVPAGTAVTVTFQILCRPQYAGSCDLPEGNTTTASFSVATDDFCPRVVEVASITPALTTYSDSGRTSVSTNYILETTLFARVTADVEAGLQAKRTTLTGLDIVSSCTGCTPLVQPFTDGLSDALADYGFQYASGGTDNTATGGEVQTDFSFTLNTNSLSFDNDATTGEAQITLTAYVTVEYDTPSAQGLERSYRVQAVSGPGSIGSSASANFGVSGSTPAGGTTGGGSSSTAGSTVLGVSTGTAALAAVGLAAVAAVAFGAAVAARHRRHRTPAKLAPSSSSSSSTVASLELGAAAPAVPGMSTDDLGAVQTAYDASSV